MTDQPLSETSPGEKNIQVGDVQAGTVNIAGGNIIQVAAGGTLIMGSQAGAGIRTLNNLMQTDGRLLAITAGFTNDFQAACTQVDILADYKELHDLLHQVQFHCFEPISLESSRFPEESSLDAIDSYRRNLGDILTQLNVLAGKQRLPGGDTAFILELSSAQQEVGQAVNSLEAAPLKKAIWRMKRLLSIQPVRINTRLIDTARALRLNSLLQALEQINHHLAGMELPAEQGSSFQNGLNALLQLSQSLELLLVEHDAWQAVDTELRRIEVLIEQDLVELEMSWPDIKQQAGKLFANPALPGAGALQSAAQNLDATLGSDMPLKTRRAFRSFRRESGSRFFQVDIDLRHLCDELRLIGEPLNALLKNLPSS